MGGYGETVAPMHRCADTPKTSLGLYTSRRREWLDVASLCWETVLRAAPTCSDVPAPLPASNCQSSSSFKHAVARINAGPVRDPCNGLMYKVTPATTSVWQAYRRGPSLPQHYRRVAWSTSAQQRKAESREQRAEGREQIATIVQRSAHNLRSRQNAIHVAFAMIRKTSCARRP